MNILCINPSVSMRAYRQMGALSEAGNRVDLFYLNYGGSIKEVDESFLNRRQRIEKMNYPLSHIPRTLIPASFKKEISWIVRNGDYDIIFAHSMPDIIGVASKRYSDLPVVFDVRDMVSSFGKIDIIKNYIPRTLLKYGPVKSIGEATFYRGVLRMEREALETSDGRTFVSDYNLTLAEKKYDLPPDNNLVFYNYAMEKDMREGPGKLSETDGELHIVYQGVISSTGYRAPLLDLFKKITGMGINMHIYGIGDEEVKKRYRDVSRSDNLLHFNEAVSQEKLMWELTKYDYGIIPFNPPESEREHFDTMMPNKLFDYLVAGLPVIAPDSVALKRFVTRERCGTIYHRIEDLNPEELEDTPKIERENYTIERHIGRMEALFRKLI